MEPMACKLSCTQILRVGISSGLPPKKDLNLETKARYMLDFEHWRITLRSIVWKAFLNTGREDVH